MPITCSRTGFATLLLVALVLAPRPSSAFFGDDVADEAARIARTLELRPGEVVADVGAGDGDHAIALAAIVGPAGHVLATELDDDALEEIRENVADARVENVSVLKGAVDATNLPRGCCDAVVMRDVYHHLTAPAAIDASVLAALKPGGRFLVIDFVPSFWLSPWTPDGVPADRGGHGVPIDVVVREVEAAGFRKVRVDEDWPSGLFTDLFAVLFVKPGSEDASSGS